MGNTRNAKSVIRFELKQIQYIPSNQLYRRANASIFWFITSRPGLCVYLSPSIALSVGLETSEGILFEKI